MLLEDGRLSAALIHFWPGNAIRVVAKDPLPVNEWTHVALTYDGSSRARGLRLFVNGREADVDVVRDCLTKDINRGGENRLTIGQRFRDRGFKGGMIDDFRIFDRALSPFEVRILHGSADGAGVRAELEALDYRDQFDAVSPRHDDYRPSGFAKERSAASATTFPD